MTSIVQRIAAFFNRTANEPREAAWLCLPAWTGETTELKVPQHHSIQVYQDALARHDRSSAATLRQINMSGLYTVNLADNSCNCSEWQRVSKAMPTHDLRRVCKHIVKAILHHKAEYNGEWNEWTLIILSAINNGFSYGVFTSFTEQFFSNGDERFLALYDNSRGYVELFSQNGGCFGYDSGRNRWANAIAPNKPLN